MSDLPASVTVAQGWADRAQRAAADLEAARTAPALFKPEWSERASAELTEALGHLGYWSGIGGG